MDLINLKALAQKYFPKALLFRLHQLRGYLLILTYSNRKKVQGAIGEISAEWARRIDDVISCPDNLYLERVPHAGEVSNGLVTMHNGIQVSGLGYYGAGILNMLVKNPGVHEPQEERAFSEILRYLPPGATMIECGAYWGFYSLWFKKTILNANCFLIEPMFANIQSGKMNFR